MLINNVGGFMSVIVAIKKDGVVYIGCDSQVTSGGTRTTLRNENNYKIWKVNNAEKCLMGSVGNLRDACVVRTMDDLVSEYNIFKNHISYQFIVNKLVPDIIERLRSVDYIKREGVFEGMDSSYLFAFEDQLYQIHNDGSVIEVDDYVAIGSGRNEAIGSLLSTENDEPRNRIIKAIKSSAASDIYVDYPIVLVDTNKLAFEIIMEDEKN